MKKSMDKRKNYHNSKNKFYQLEESLRQADVKQSTDPAKEMAN